MSGQHSSQAKPPHDLPVYHICLEGHLDTQWEGWFEGMSITLADDGTTLLSGPVIDQAALHGLLRKIRDLGMPLICIRRINSGPAASDVND